MKQIIKKPQGHLIETVEACSVAARAGIKPGWRLLKIDHRYITDVLDYLIMTADQKLTLLFETEEGYLRRKKLILPAEESLGLKFASPALSPVQRCSNRCLFCFVDQNPPGMRQSLYLKDEDYRLSFLYGNYITLNRLTASELKRIVKLNLSPLYVSVHATAPRLRQFIFRNRHAARGLANLKKLLAAGIKVHTQVVLCPGINTGGVLKKTISDLEKMGKNILSVALVPVGLTAHRQGLFALKPFDEAAAKEVLEFTEARQKLYLKQRKSRFVFAADEFYSLAGLDYPPAKAYEGYQQLENGVGLARLFLEELAVLKAKMPLFLENPLKITLLTGVSGFKLLEKLKNLLSLISGLGVNLVIAKNRHFGAGVTVSGLLTGGDILDCLTGKEAGDLLFITQSALKDNSNMFLDNLSVHQLEEKLGTKIKAAAGPQAVLDEIIRAAAKPAASKE